MMPNNFTTKSREALEAAQKIALDAQHPEFHPLHLLTALLGQADGVVVSVMKKMGVNLEQISRPVQDERERSWRGFNFCLGHDLTVLLAILRGEYQISGLSNRLLQRVLTGKKGGQISRVLKRLRLHGLSQKIGHTYKYYVTALGQRALLAALKLKEHLILPALMTPTPTSETA